MSLFGVFLVRIFPYLDSIQRDISYLPVFSPNAEKYGPENLRILTPFTYCKRVSISADLKNFGYLTVKLFFVFHLTLAKETLTSDI